MSDEERGPDTIRQRESERPTFEPGELDEVALENGPHWAAYINDHRDVLEG